MAKTRASDFFRFAVERHWQFVDLPAAWTEFVVYLDDRQGADLRSVFAYDQIRLACECVAAMDRGEELGIRAEWFGEFDLRDDVVQAAVKFLRWRGLAEVVDAVHARRGVPGVESARL